MSYCGFFFVCLFWFSFCVLFVCCSFLVFASWCVCVCEKKRDRKRDGEGKGGEEEEEGREVS